MLYMNKINATSRNEYMGLSSTIVTVVDVVR